MLRVSLLLMQHIEFTGVIWPTSHSSVGIGVQDTGVHADTLAAVTNVSTKLSFASDLGVLCFLQDPWNW